MFFNSGDNDRISTFALVECIHFVSFRLGHVDTQRSEPRKRNLFLQSLYEEADKAKEIEDKDIVGCLDEGVECWTDFSKSHFHPQSLYELNGLWMDSQDFDNYGIGKDVFSESSRGEEICDRLRFFVEECDHIQVKLEPFFCFFPNCFCFLKIVIH